MFLLRSALACFSRIPVGQLPDEAFAHAMRRLPSVGLVVGLLVSAVMLGASFLWPIYIAALFGLMVWVAVTGAIHLDGVADCGDGLFMQAPVERRLAVMKDPTLGAFGAITLVLMLALKWSGLCGLGQNFVEYGQSLQWHMAIVYITSPICFGAILGRILTFVFMHFPCARPSGMGNSMVDAVTVGDKIFAALLLLAVFAPLVASHGLWPSLVMLAGGLTFATAIMLKVMRTLGGVTGDVYGFIIEGTECGVLLAAATII